MNRILPTVVAFFCSKIDTLKEIILEFSRINNCFLLLSKAGQNRRGLSKFFLFSLVFLFVVSFANAATFTSRADGNWNVAATWTKTGTGGGTFPQAGDIVILANGFDVTLMQNESCASLTINGNWIK